ncbi:MAG: pseudouridine synthase [Candidatus Methanosuratincola sp.]
MLVRLQKVLAEMGVASRRRCKELIKQGRVRVDGVVVTETGYKVDPERCTIEVDGVVHRLPPKIYLAMNKPPYVLTTLKDPRGRPTVESLLPPLPARVKPVGRLDYRSEGLLLFTNDGDLLQRLTHPRYGVEKTYEVHARGCVGQKEAERLEKGVMIEGRLTKGRVRFLRYIPERDETVLEVTVHEGRKHVVRKMIRAVGSEVNRLVRVSVGAIRLGDLKVGETRFLTEGEVSELRRSVGLE